MYIIFYPSVSVFFLINLDIQLTKSTVILTINIKASFVYIK